jgi:hypothetical protein
MTEESCSPVAMEIHARLRPVLPGVLLGVLTLLYGFGLGVFFGVNEDALKGRLKAGAEAVKATTYKGDEAAVKLVLERSWTYMKRAHLHAGGLGVNTIALSLLLVAVGAGATHSRWISLALGAGGLGYSIYWMWAGFRAPGMGGTGPAKESLKWLAMPTSGAVLLATIAVAWLVFAALRRPAADAR